MSLPAFLLLTDTAENRTLCRARALGKRVSVFSPRARTPAGGRSRCGFAKQIRGFSAQRPSQIWVRCRLSSGCPCLASTQAPCRGESNSMQGAGVKKTLRQRRVGRAFPMAAQAESASRNPHSDWDVVSGWHIKWKPHPGILIRNGMHFPDGLLAESSFRNPRSERDALSQRRSKRKAHPGIPPQTGTRFPLHLLNSKTYAPSIPKLGRRRPKRNRRRST